MANGEPESIPCLTPLIAAGILPSYPGPPLFSIFGRLLHDAEICLLYEKSFLILCWNPDFSHSTLS